MMAMIHLRMLMFLTSQSKEHSPLKDQFVFQYHQQRSTQGIRHCIYPKIYGTRCHWNQYNKFIAVFPNLTSCSKYQVKWRQILLIIISMHCYYWWQWSVRNDHLIFAEWSSVSNTDCSSSDYNAKSHCHESCQEEMCKILGPCTKTTWNFLLGMN